MSRGHYVSRDFHSVKGRNICWLYEIMLLSVDEGLMSYAPLKLIVKSSNEGLPAFLVVCHMDADLVWQ